MPGPALIGLANILRSMPLAEGQALGAQLQEQYGTKRYDPLAELVRKRSENKILDEDKTVPLETQPKPLLSEETVATASSEQLQSLAGIIAVELASRQEEGSS